MSTITVYTLEDSYVDQSSPTTNFNNAGPSGNLVTFGGISSDEQRTWFKFDLSSIPAGSTINSATVIIGEWQTTGSYAQIFNINRCTDNSWTETGITWNNAPNGSVVGSPTHSIQENEAGTINFDATSDVAAALASGKLSYRIAEDSLDGATLWIYDRETSSMQMSLTIDYTAPSGSTDGLLKFF